MAAQPEPAARTGTPVRARGAGAPRELALPRAAHLHGGHIGGVVAANYCSEFRFDKACTRLVVIQALQGAKRGAHDLVKTVHKAMSNDYQKHTVSAIHGGAKTTMRTTYVGYIDIFFTWGAANMTTTLLPLIRHVVVSYLEAEATRRIARSVRSAQRRRRATTTSLASARSESDGGGLCSSSDDAVEQEDDEAEVPVVLERHAQR